MSEALVVGAGIVGAACARALAQAGFAVTVFEAAAVGAGATRAGMGHVVVIDEPAGELALSARSRRLWDELAGELPAEVERAVCGTLWLAAGEEEQAEAERKAGRLAAAGVAAEWLDAAALARLEPGLRSGFRGALRVPGDSVIYAPRAAAWLLERSGARLELGARVRRLVARGVEFGDGSTRRADVVVNAAGLAARELTPGLPLRARKGHLVISERCPGLCAHQLVDLSYVRLAHGDAAESVAFNVQPRPNGQLLIGSSRQFDVEDPAVEPRMLARVVALAVENLPALARVPALRAWTGLRAATPDGQPLIGALPGLDGVYVAAGHEGLGITTALATAELIAAAATGRAAPIDAAPYRPGRFAEAARG